MTTAVPAAIHQPFPEDLPFAVSFPASSSALVAQFASVSGFGTTPATVPFFGHVSQVSAEFARETDPRLIVRKQAAQRIATTDLIVVRRRGPRMSSPLWKRHIIVTTSDYCDIP
jgi:hypothetical protein